MPNSIASSGSVIPFFLLCRKLRDEDIHVQIPLLGKKIRKAEDSEPRKASSESAVRGRKTEWDV